MNTPDISNIDQTTKGILLDLDNTLYEYEPCHTYALEQCYQLCNNTIEKVSFETFHVEYLQGRESVKKHNKGTSGSRSRHLYFQRMLEISHGKIDVRHALMLGDRYWETFLEKMTLRPWVAPFLKGAQHRGIQVTVLTNLESSIQFKKLIRLGIESHISYVVTSEEAGVEKPDPKIFQLALDKMNLNPYDMIMLGDDPHEDGVGAERVGISFILVDHDSRSTNEEL